MKDSNGHTYTVDADGDRLYDLPADWSLDKNPHEMNGRELAAASARLLGCVPDWSAYYGDWICPCRGGDHACDSQCSVIADYPKDIRYAHRIAIWMEKQGMEVPKATAGPKEICKAALAAAALR